MSEFREEKSRTSQQLGQIGGVDTVETSFERSLSDFLFLSHSFMMLSFDCYWHEITNSHVQIVATYQTDPFRFAT